MIHLKRIRPRCLGIAMAVTLATVSVYLYLEMPSSEDSSFPVSSFLSRWNSSPYCGEPVSRRIHLMYNSQLIPRAFEDHVKSWTKHYPKFELHFWTDSGIEAFLQKQYGPEMVRFLKNSLAHGVERSDFSRLLIINHFGGMYADLDVLALRSAETLMQSHSLIFTEEPLPHAVFLYDQSSLISNAIVYSKPCHEFWRYYFQYYPAYLQAHFGGYWSWRRRRRHRNLAVHATGPVPLDKFAKQFIEQRRPSPASVLVAPPMSFQPRIDVGAPAWSKLRSTCLSAVGRARLSELQRSHCGDLLNNPDGLLARRTLRPAVSYARHDFLHIGYDEAKTDTVAVDALLPAAILHR